MSGNYRNHEQRFSKLDSRVNGFLEATRNSFTGGRPPSLHETRPSNATSQVIEQTDKQNERTGFLADRAALRIVIKNLDIKWNAASQPDQALALQLAYDAFKSKQPTEILIEHLPPRLVNLVSLLILMSQLMFACVPAPDADPTVSPTAIPTEITEIPLSDITGAYTTPIAKQETPSPAPPLPTDENPEPLSIAFPTDISGWRFDEVGPDKNKADKKIIEGVAPNDLGVVKNELTAQAKEQGIQIKEFIVRTVDGIWTVVILDVNGKIWYAVDVKTKLPFAQLFPFGITNEGWTLASDPLTTNGNYQDVAGSVNNDSFGVVEYDSKGNPVEFLSLENGKMVKINLPPNLPKGYQIINDGNSIVDKDGKPLYLFNLETKQWERIEQGVKWTVVENIEDCAKNPLNDADMAPGGRVDQYLDSIKDKLMAATNWDIIKDDIPFRVYGGMMIYLPESNAGRVKFVNPEKDPSVPDTNPFDRDIDAFGLYTAKNGRKYCLIPLVIRDIHAPTETGNDIYFMKMLLPLQKDDGTPLSQFEIDYMYANWNNRMNIAPIGYGNSTRGWLWDADENPDGDPMFDYLKKGSPEFELWTSVFNALGRQEPVHGPLSELLKLKGKVFLTNAYNLSDENGLSDILK